MKNITTKLLALMLMLALCFSISSCSLVGPNDNGGNNGDDGDDLLGITDDTIWVGNTAATTGGSADVGAPFKLGIEAAFAAYNAAGGYNGKKIALKHYDDQSSADNSIILLDKLIKEDEVFAVVGHFGSYAVDATIDTLKDEKVPMIYAAAGNNALFNENATSLGEKGIFPVQPLNVTEGRMMILRAFAPADKGGFEAKKVGVIANSNEASQALLAGIKAEVKDSKLDESKIVYQEVASADYTGAVNNLKDQGCDLVIITVISTDFTTALSTMADANFKCSVLTSYNNASTNLFNDKNTTVMKPGFENIFKTMYVFYQGWVDVTSTDYEYKDEDSNLYKAYKFYRLLNENGAVAGFTEEYWQVANNIYNYALTVPNMSQTAAFGMSYDAYALAGYIAGDLFCQAMEALEKSGKALSRANLIEVMESQEFDVCMSSTISFANGLRKGVEAFSLNMFFNAKDYDSTKDNSASSTLVYGLTTIEDYRALLADK